MGEYQNVKMTIEARTAILTIDHPPANAFDTQTVTDLKQSHPVIEFIHMNELPKVQVRPAGPIKRPEEK